MRLALLLALFAVALSLSFSSAAVVTGTVYDSGTLDVVEKAIVTVNTVPEQVKVTQAGEYSFELQDGNYTITAKKYLGKAVELEAQENITVTGNGTYVIDLLLLPPDGVFSVDEGNQSIEEVDFQPSPMAYDAVQTAAGIGILLIVAYYLAKMKKPTPGKPNGAAAKGKKAPATSRPAGLVLAPEQQQAVSILKKSGGFASQKELRKLMPYSEAKVSLIVTELEEMGAVKRFKRGRGNIIKLLKG